MLVGGLFEGLAVIEAPFPPSLSCRLQQPSTRAEAHAWPATGSTTRSSTQAQHRCSGAGCAGSRRGAASNPAAGEVLLALGGVRVLVALGGVVKHRVSGAGGGIIILNATLHVLTC